MLDMPSVRDVFETSTDFTVGIEEEFGILDPDTRALTHRFDELYTAAQEDPVLAESVAVPGGGDVKVAVRRTADGAMFSQAVAGPGVDLTDPEVARVVDATESRVRGASGLPL
jgi:hypothetical protein